MSPGRSLELPPDLSLVPLLPGRSPVLLQGVLPPDLPDRLPGVLPLDQSPEVLLPDRLPRVLPLDQSPEVLPESASLPVLSY